MDTKKARWLTNRIIGMLNDRKGFDDWWDEIDASDRKDVRVAIGQFLIKHSAQPTIDRANKRIELLEAFAHEALEHLHDHLWHPSTQGRLSDEQWAEMKKEAQAFVARHCDDFNGDFTIAKIQLTEK